MYWFPLLSPLWFLAALLNSFYDPYVTVHCRHTAKALIQFTVVLLVAFLLIYFLPSPASLPRRFVLYFVTFSFALLVIWRSIYTVYLGPSPFQLRAIIVAGATLGPASPR